MSGFRPESLWTRKGQGGSVALGLGKGGRGGGEGPFSLETTSPTRVQQLGGHSSL